MQILNGTGAQQHDKRKVNRGRIPSDTVRQIHKLAKEGHPVNEIAILTDISEAAIERSLSGKSHQAIWLEFNPAKEPQGVMTDEQANAQREQEKKSWLQRYAELKVVFPDGSVDTPEGFKLFWNAAFESAARIGKTYAKYEIKPMVSTSTLRHEDLVIGAVYRCKDCTYLVSGKQDSPPMIQVQMVTWYTGYENDTGEKFRDLNSWWTSSAWLCEEGERIA